MKIKLLCIFLGFFLIMLSYSVQGMSLNLTPNETNFVLQQGTQGSFSVEYKFSPEYLSEPVLVKTYSNSVKGINLEFGAGNSHLFYAGSIFQGFISIDRNMKPGFYSPELIVEYENEGILARKNIIFSVKVIPKQDSIYLIEENNNQAPEIRGIYLSESFLLMQRNESRELFVNYRNTGRASNFSLYIEGEQKELTLTPLTEKENKLFFRADTNSSTAQGIYYFKIWLKDNFSGKQYLADTLTVSVKPFYDLDAVVLGNDLQLNLNESKTGKILIENKSKFPQSISIISSSNEVFLPEKIDLNALEKKEIEFTINSIESGKKNARITLIGEENTQRHIFLSFNVSGEKEASIVSSVVSSGIKGANSAATGFVSLIDSNSGIAIGLLLILVVFFYSKYSNLKNKAQTIEEVKEIKKELKEIKESESLQAEKLESHESVFNKKYWTKIAVQAEKEFEKEENF